MTGVGISMLDISIMSQCTLLVIKVYPILFANLICVLLKCYVMISTVQGCPKEMEFFYSNHIAIWCIFVEILLVIAQVQTKKVTAIISLIVMK